MEEMSVFKSYLRRLLQDLKDLKEALKNKEEKLISKCAFLNYPKSVNKTYNQQIVTLEPRGAELPTQNGNTQDDI